MWCLLQPNYWWINLIIKLGSVHLNVAAYTSPSTPHSTHSTKEFTCDFYWKSVPNGWLTFNIWIKCVTIQLRDNSHTNAQMNRYFPHYLTPNELNALKPSKYIFSANISWINALKLSAKSFPAENSNWKHLSIILQSIECPIGYYAFN